MTKRNWWRVEKERQMRRAGSESVRTGDSVPIHTRGRELRAENPKKSIIQRVFGPFTSGYQRDIDPRILNVWAKASDQDRKWIVEVVVGAGEFCRPSSKWTTGAVQILVNALARRLEERPEIWVQLQREINGKRIRAR